MFKKKSLRLGVLVIFGAIAIGLIPVIKNHANDDKPTLTLKEDVSELKRTASGALPNSYAPIIEKSSKAVVKVYSSKIVKRRSMQNHPFFNDPFFRDFFGDRQPPQGEQKQRQQKQRQQGLGSGVIISTDGYILTNNHVIDGADEIKVTISSSKKEYVAELIGTDPKTDIALLKIKADKLPAITVADSNKSKIGDIVFAIGNPFGIGTTVTKGIISAKGRDIGLVDYEGFLQTDAAINPGNSGGALIDATGRLIGINAAILSRSGGSQGIGFAIPINMAKQIAQTLIESGSVSRGFLGVGIQDITPELKEAFELKDTKGALVTTVSKDSAAEAAGINPGDVIVTFNGKAVKDVQSLRFIVASTPPGKEVKIEIIRDGKAKTVTATLKSQDGETVAAADTPSPSHKLLDGVKLKALTDEHKQMYRIPDSVNGILVETLEVGSKAEAAGLQAGDVLTEVNKTPVTSISDFAKAVKKASDDKILLRVWRKGGHLYLVVK